MTGGSGGGAGARRFIAVASAPDRPTASLGAPAERTGGNAVLGVGHGLRRLQSPDGELAKLWLGEPKVTVEVVKLLLEAVESVEVLVRCRPEGRHVCTVRLPSDDTTQLSV